MYAYIIFKTFLFYNLIYKLCIQPVKLIILNTVIDFHYYIYIIIYIYIFLNMYVQSKYFIKCLERVGMNNKYL